MQPLYYPVENYAQDVLNEARERAARERLIAELRRRERTSNHLAPLAWLADLWQKISQRSIIVESR